ncbi:unnamed protein product [Psylliodes chrysocephalus]|uniref:Uncharacterized protein n=1 Tax=Psylliodes chrysocephalus TaxID=3402493 RepID=A0A9P0CT20_9CUCU|nr:unnamed protein product [Psylliodes chrysocephala]
MEGLYESSKSDDGDSNNSNPELTRNQKQSVRRLSSSSSDEEYTRNPVIVTADVHQSKKAEEISQLLGEEPSLNTVFGDTISNYIVSRWSAYLSKGLEKELRETLAEKWRIPENCPLLCAPKVNNEILGLYSSTDLRKDNFLSAVQDKMGKGLSALGFALDVILKHQNSENINLENDILPAIVDSAKLFCESHFLVSRHRRYEILLAMKETVMKIAEESVPDSFLFGLDFNEKCESAQTAQHALKDYKAKTPSRIKNSKFNSSNFLNSKRPYQKHKIRESTEYRYKRKQPEYRYNPGTRRTQYQRI